MIGQTLSHFKITAKLGEGGMGEVYRAEDTQLGREVAIKVLPEAFSQDADRLARFEREARAIAALSHPNILAVYDFGSQDGSTFVVTELLDGETLRDRLAEGPLPSRKAAELGRQIAQGLAAAHDKGIVHRDLKPENLFVTREGRVKILDFGLATAPGEGGSGPGERSLDTEAATRTSLTAPGTVMGTVGYMSPEQVRAEPTDHRSDIFSLGSVLYEMVTAVAPFRRETKAETMTAILKEEPAEPASLGAEVPPALATIIQRCMEKRPDERFQSAHDLAFSLQALSDSVGPSGAVARLRTAPRPRRRLGLPAAAGLLLLGLLAGWGVSRLAGSGPGAPEPPTFTPLSSRRGTVINARFVPGEESALYSAAWDGGAVRLYTASRGARTSDPLKLEGADLLAISSTGELALALHRRYPGGWEAIGTLAVARPGGSAPREILEDVLAADWAPDGESLAVAHEVDGVVRLEYPIGTVLYESSGWISRLRVHPDGDRVLIGDNPVRGDNRAVIRIVDRQKNVTTVSRNAAWGLLWAPDGESILSSNGGAVFLTEPGTEPRAVFRSASATHLLDIDPAGRLLVADTSVRREMIVHAPGAEEEANLSWLDWSYAAALSRDGRLVIFEEGNDSTDEGYGIYLRETSGTAPLLLGYGFTVALSPDGRWLAVAQRLFSDDPDLVLIPIGPGQPRTLDVGDLRPQQHAGAWIPASSEGDPEELVFAASDPQGSDRIYRLPLTEGAEPQPITPQGFTLAPIGHVVSPEGRRIVVKPPGGAPVEFGLDGDGPRVVPGAEPHDLPVAFGLDGVHLYVRAGSALPTPVFAIDTRTGERVLWRELAPPDPAGIFSLDFLQISADGSAYAYSNRRIISSLNLVDGLL